jgi:hypothetical protein
MERKIIVTQIVSAPGDRPKLNIKFRTISRIEYFNVNDERGVKVNLQVYHVESNESVLYFSYNTIRISS